MGELVKATLTDGRIITEDTDAARELYNQSRYGEPFNKLRIHLSVFEAAYLLEKGRLAIITQRKKELTFEEFVGKIKKYEHNFYVKFVVFRDIRNRGYIIKTALKFGADFRVYDRGIKPGEDHAKWIVYPVHESSTLTWHEFSAKNRVAHSTKKRLLIAVVDEEGDVSYWEARWVRP